MERSAMPPWMVYDFRRNDDPDWNGFVGQFQSAGTWWIVASVLAILSLGVTLFLHHGSTSRVHGAERNAPAPRGKGIPYAGEVAARGRCIALRSMHPTSTSVVQLTSYTSDGSDRPERANSRPSRAL